MFCVKQQLMMHFIKNLSLNFLSFLGLYLNGCGSSGDNNWWYRISTNYWVENRQLSLFVYIKSTHEFKWYTKTFWPNRKKMLG